ncbi:Oidioi.mRNA.OKI2018_I69.XSR.g14138.t1.cds [Oikopleura dioica]|uniref:Oidioi.mRNA.OKI2018_I69.XSR.g14138.t1.cds n=1 Tax=Oikopleura dioica TaxID=34765 RepID=A0ABN7SG64_OIKDI|nr:Oidioi.mRNA.OKI2018_I69.XSR.g14138.t1.cds [Oikopleura dioica]
MSSSQINGNTRQKILRQLRNIIPRPITISPDDPNAPPERRFPVRVSPLNVPFEYPAEPIFKVPKVPKSMFFYDTPKPKPEPEPIVGISQRTVWCPLKSKNQLKVTPIYAWGWDRTYARSRDLEKAGIKFVPPSERRNRVVIPYYPPNSDSATPLAPKSKNIKIQIQRDEPEAQLPDQVPTLQLPTRQLPLPEQDLFGVNSEEVPQPLFPPKEDDEEDEDPFNTSFVGEGDDDDEDDENGEYRGRINEEVEEKADDFKENWDPNAPGPSSPGTDPGTPRPGASTRRPASRQISKDESSPMMDLYGPEIVTSIYNVRRDALKRL